MKKLISKLLLLSCVLLVLLPLAASADVGFTKDGAADPKNVYVAGNPDWVSVESFDADSGTYIGAVPSFLQLVSEQTKLNFVYIRAGEQDRRETLAKNNQVDLLFASADEKEILDLGVETVKLFSVTKNDEPTDVYCVFTAVSDENNREKIRSAANNLTKDDLSQILTADSTEFVSKRQFLTNMILPGVAIFLALLLVMILLIALLKRRHKKEEFAGNAGENGNKQHFVRMFQSTISDQAGELYYVLHLEFDRAQIHDNFGAEESDKILRHAANTLKEKTRDHEFFSQIGEAAFAAAIYSSSTDQVKNRTEEILQALNAYGEENIKAEIPSLFRAGICATVPDDKDADQALYNADQAYRRAVKEKKPFVFISRDALNEHQFQVAIRKQVRQALEQHAFTPYVQFIMCVKDGSIGGGELLSRWPNRQFGLLNPGSYVPILQELGLIVNHDLLMLEEACKLLQEWNSQGKKRFLNCNLSRITISDPLLVDKILSITDQYSFARENLILEVTEDSLEENKDYALHNMASLKNNGFCIALDDFSSGYTAVSNLYEYAVDVVKLDRHMILDADRDPNAAALLNEVTRLCHELHIRVLAEGVETDKQAQLIQTASCDYIQGYYYVRPLPLRELNGFETKYLPKIQSKFGDSPKENLQEPTHDDTATQKGETTMIPNEIHGTEQNTEIKTEQSNPFQVVQSEPIQPVQNVPFQTAQPVTAQAVPPAAFQAAQPVAPQVAQPVAFQAAQPAAPQAVPVPFQAAQPVAPQAAQPEPIQTEQNIPFQVVQTEPIQAEQSNTSQADQGEPHGKSNLLKIQYGPYTLDLPGDVDMASVCEILRAIQDKLM